MLYRKVERDKDALDHLMQAYQAASDQQRCAGAYRLYIVFSEAVLQSVPVFSRRRRTV